MLCPSGHECDIARRQFETTGLLLFTSGCFALEVCSNCLNGVYGRADEEHASACCCVYYGI